MSHEDVRQPGLRLPALDGNPYEEAVAEHEQRPDDAEFLHLLRRYGFAVPSRAALDLLAAHSPAGVVEIGAGTGYWARLLHEHGVDVVAYDLAPPPAEMNPWFAGQQPWYPVQQGTEQRVLDHPDRTLLLVWPTRNENWAADAAQLHLDGGGEYLVYVGEEPGGRTGDLRLHALLGLVDGCLACAYGVLTAPCTCGVTDRWRLLQRLALPMWQGEDQRLYLFTRPARRDIPRVKRPSPWFRGRSRG